MKSEIFCSEIFCSAIRRRAEVDVEFFYKFPNAIHFKATLAARRIHFTH